MLQGDASLALDVRAMAQLDRWLGLPADERASMLDELARTEPELHLRVQRLVAVCDTGSSGAASQALAAPVLQAAQGLLAGHGLQPGDGLAGWRLLRELGRGGMSVVWLAERADGSLKRRVALKLPLAAHLSAHLGERFARERDVLAQLTHPHIARLYDAGITPEGQPFIALEHVQGVPITQYADEHRLNLRQRLQLFRQVLAAVDHAHRHLVVHRDLKPANILVDEEGQVKLLDFGIAKLLALPDGAAALTLEAGAVMTPRYAAPEQMAGGPITTATDVHAAGVVLYELLTGRLPLGGADTSMAALAHAVQHDEPLPPSRATAHPPLRRQLAGDLDTVLLKALRKDPAERYASIERLGEDLRRVLASEPVLARRVPLLHRLRLLVRRHRAGSAVAGLAAVAVLAAGGVALQQYQASQAQRTRADAVRDFLFDMVSDAEPDESSPDGQVTGQQMVDAALKRARNDFATQPLLQGEVLGELGRIDLRLGRERQGRVSLEQTIELLQRYGPAGNPALHKARAHLARSLMHDNSARTELLATAAMEGCVQAGRECAKARSYAHAALRDLYDARGKGDDALRHARAVVVESAIAFAPTDPAMVVALESEAVVARNAGRLAEAQTALDRAFVAAEHSTLKASGRLGLRRMKAVLALDRGRYGEAAEAFGALQSAAWDADDRMGLNRLLAQARLGTGELAAAAAAAEQALADADKEGIDPIQRLRALQVQAKALAALGKTAEAQVHLAKADASIRSLGASTHTFEGLRQRRLKVELTLRNGDAASALQQTTALLALHHDAPTVNVIEQAEALDLAGCVEQAHAHHTAAADLHAQARRTYRLQLPEDHPLLARNALFAASAALGASPHAASRRRWLDAAAAYRKVLSSNAAWQPLLAENSLPVAPLAGPPRVCQML